MNNLAYICEPLINLYIKENKLPLASLKTSFDYFIKV